jgi:membrane complex biogenesis BtpA family protein
VPSRPDVHWRELFQGGRPVIGMVHVLPLPGSPRYQGSMAAVQDAAAADASVLAETGFDALFYVNEGDAPFPSMAPQETVAALAAVVAATCPKEIPHGVEVLFDPGASLSVAAATGASFIRGGVLGVWEGTSGVRSGDAAMLLRRRHALRLDHVGIFGVAQAELAVPLSGMDLKRRLQLAVTERAVDVVLLGADPGQAAASELLEQVRGVVGEVPVLANSGVRADTVAEVLRAYDGCVVGSDLKCDGRLSNPVDRTRAEALIAAARPARQHRRLREVTV